MNTITKGQKYQYISQTGRGMQHLRIFTVTRTGEKFTVLEPEKMSLTNQSFRIDTKDFSESIELGFYKQI